ncbi:MAG TPA: MXAN_5187 C-terminal domain-containing protein [Kofleriaceae bacterium]|nr:MXAN_5187 C-terminal domain-containing protein [Kofleriaceae bacterium]
MALGSDLKKQQITPEELEELLSGLEKLLDRTKVLYEQYFMGIQKVAPMQLHRDIERRVRDLMQQQIRNTSMRFRFTTISQKFGAYQTYWKRTLREIEQGKYVRDLVRVKKKADALGEDLPEELLVKLPKLVQDRIRRDRARMAERALRSESESGDTLLDAAALDDLALTETPDEAPVVHSISEEEAQTLFNEGDLDMDGLFSALTGKQAEAAPAHVAEAVAVPAVEAAPAQAPEPVAAQVAEAAPAHVAEAVPTPVAEAVPTPVAESEPASSTRPTVTLPRGVAVSRPAARAEPGFRVPLPRGPGRAEPKASSETDAAEVAPAAPVIPVTPVVTRVTASSPATPAAARPAAGAPPPAPATRPTEQRASPPRHRTATAPRIATPPLPAPDLPPGMDEKQCRELYARYLKARQLVGESNDDVTYDRLVSSLRKQASTIMNEHGARGVQFHVVVRGEKVVLKARPLKPGKPGE